MKRPRVSPWSKMKLWQKQLIIYLSISMIPLICLTAYTTYSTVKLANTQISMRLSEITDNAGSNIERSFETVNSMIEPQLYDDRFLLEVYNCTHSPGSYQGLKNYLQELQQQLATVFGDSVNLEFLLPDRTLISTAGVYQLTSDISGWTDVFRDNRYRFVTCSDNTISIYYQTANLYQSNDSIGVLRFSVAAPTFIGRLSVNGIDEYIFVIQDDVGDTIYLNAYTHRNYGNIILNILQRTDHNTIRIREDVYIYHPLYLDQFDWNLCVLIPQSVLYQNFPSLLYYCITISLVCLMLVALFSMISSLRLAGRINHIGSEMAIISSGQLEDIHFNIDTAGDEIGQLSELFHHMIDRINSLVIQQYKSEIKIKEEQLKILQNQINPHFLYNCMDTINWRCIMNKDDKTSRFANNLATFYRTCLNKGNVRTGLNDEFRNIHAYIYLQSDMHDNSFDYVEEVNPDIYEYECINLMLQPIIENALEHGIATPGKERGLIRLTADFDGPARSRIIISIFNSGTSIDPDVAEAVMRGEKGYGFSNVANRIRHYFGPEYGISIRPTDGGTLCTIEIPTKRWIDE